MPNLQIEYTPIYALRAQRQNARTHSKRQIRQIADSIPAFWLLQSESWSTTTERFLAGHGRVKAAELLGLAEVPTVRLSHLGEADKRAYVIRRQSFSRESRLGSRPAGH